MVKFPLYASGAFLGAAYSAWVHVGSALMAVAFLAGAIVLGAVAAHAAYRLQDSSRPSAG